MTDPLLDYTPAFGTDCLMCGGDECPWWYGLEDRHDRTVWRNLIDSLRGAP